MSTPSVASIRIRTDSWRVTSHLFTPLPARSICTDARSAPGRAIPDGSAGAGAHRALLIAVLALGNITMASVSEGQLAPHALTTLPIDDPAYAQLRALDRGGCREARISPHRPFLVRDVQRAIQAFAGNPRCAGAIAAVLGARFTAPRGSVIGDNVAPDLAAAAREAAADTLETFRYGARITLRGTALARGEFEPRWAGVRPRDEGTPPAVLDARARAAWSPSAHLVAAAELFGLTSRRNDPSVRQRALRNTSGIVDLGETYVNGSLGRFDVSFGRSWAAWLGDGTESLSLSANGPLLDRLEIGARWRVAEFRALVAMVNDVTMTPALDSLAATGDTRFRRWLYGHVLTVKPTQGLELTLGETLLSSRTTRGLDLAYANPLMAFVITQNDTGRVGSDPRDNLVVFGGARANIGRAQFGGELTVDDIQIDRADRQRTADQLAWRVFGSLALPVGLGSSAELEYRRVDSYAYMRDFYTDVYQQYDKPLGSVLGPGADLLRASGETWLGGEVRVAAGIEHWRQGALRIDQRPARGPNGNAGKPFPATTAVRPEIQSALVADVRAERLTLRIPIAVQVELARVRNATNLPSAAALYVRATVSGSYAFRYP